MVARPPLLTVDPSAKAPDMRHLVGIAAAIESEAIRRYASLAQEMERRGEPATAATFREMGEMEQRHRAAVDRWASALKEPVPPEQNFVWLLPPEIGASWDEVRHSSLLTPYRALAIAVTNEERAFVFYAYIAANAPDPRVAREAETMAREELAHAAELRVHRRQAYRREHPSASPPVDLAIETVAAFRSLERSLERNAAALHREIAMALTQVGDSASAALVDAMARREAESSAADEPPSSSPWPSPESVGGEPPVLLYAALKPMERASEIYEDLIAHAGSEELLRAEQAALTNLVERIAALSARINVVEGGP
jgi:rubrerythrin